MQQRYTTFLLLIVLIAISHSLFAQATFTATVFPGTITKDETAELRLMLENADNAEIFSPSLKNFIVVSGPDKKSFVAADANGINHSYAGFVFILKPKKTGTFIIDAATAKVNGKILKSNPVKLKVINTGSSKNSPGWSKLFDKSEQPTNYNDFILNKGETAQDKINKNLFIKVTADKSSCYMGEPVLVTYKLYTRLGSKCRVVKQPAFSGFSVIDLVRQERGANYTKETVNGRAYYVSILLKVQLYPLQAGAAQLETEIIANEIKLIRGDYIKSIKGDEEPQFLPGTKSSDAILDTMAMVESKPISINVKPLPEKDKPVSFNGGVGNFMMEALVEKDSLVTGDAGNLKILLSGEGNMTLVPAPEIAWPVGLEGFEPSVKDGLNKFVVPVSGSRIFNYSFTVAKEGDYTIAPIKFSFFDLASGRYKTLSTKAITVHVIKETGKRLVIAADKLNKEESFEEKIFTHRWMIIVPVALLIIIGLLFWLRVDKKKQQEKLLVATLKKQVDETADEAMIPINPLEQSEIMLIRNDTRLFYETIDKELHIFLANKFELPVETISKKMIADILDRSGIKVGDSLAVLQLLDDIALQLYTPLADENKMQDYYLEAARIINILKG